MIAQIHSFRQTSLNEVLQDTKNRRAVAGQRRQTAYQFRMRQRKLSRRQFAQYSNSRRRATQAQLAESQSQRHVSLSSYAGTCSQSVHECQSSASELVASRWEFASLTAFRFVQIVCPKLKTLTSSNSTFVAKPERPEPH
jgi:hypothetical protein